MDCFPSLGRIFLFVLRFHIFHLLGVIIQIQIEKALRCAVFIFILIVSILIGSSVLVRVILLGCFSHLMSFNILILLLGTLVVLWPQLLCRIIAKEHSLLNQFGIFNGQFRGILDAARRLLRPKHLLCRHARGQHSLHYWWFLTILFPIFHCWFHRFPGPWPLLMVLNVWYVRNKCLLNNLLCCLCIISTNEIQEAFTWHFIHSWMAISRDSRFWFWSLDIEIPQIYIVIVLVVGSRWYQEVVDLADILISILRLATSYLIKRTSL